MRPGIVLYDDAAARVMEPFALTRPLGEMRAGALLIRERWERLVGQRATAFIGSPHLSTFDEFGAPAAAKGTLKAGTVIVNSRFAPSLGARIASLAPGKAIAADGAVIAVALRDAIAADAFENGNADLADLTLGTPAKVQGWWLNSAWDLIRLLPEMLARDAATLADEVVNPPSIRADVLGEHRFVVARGAFVEPQVVVDTTAGDVVVLDGARIGAFARIAGPCVIGAHTQLAGGRYSCIAAGEHSKLCGEMSVVSVQGYANKGHDGFVGHSVLGRWSNLGAGTITSNLKNSYGKIRVEDSRGEHDTGMRFLGSLIGDHVKTAIGTRLSTGTIVGAGANVFGDSSPAKYVPPFSWGDVAPFKRYERDKFLEVAVHVMKRREIEMSDGTRDALGAAWDSTLRSKAKGKKRT